MRGICILLLASATILTGCSKPQPQPEAEPEPQSEAQPRQREMSAELRQQGNWGPEADLVAADGQVIGAAQTRKAPDGRWLVAVYSKLWDTPLPVGQHGIHIHEVGKCDTPDFASAGAHWNPTAKQHGLANSAGWHLGDLGNLEVVPPGEGSGKYFEMSTRPRGATRLDEGDAGTAPVVRDADGAAIIIHAAIDDDKTDPSGNSGDRIACAVIPAAQ